MTFFQRCSSICLTMAMVVAMFILSVSQTWAQGTVRKPSVAVSTPGVLMIYTAKGGDSPGCTSDVEYRTGGGAAQTVNVTLGNTNQKGDHYRFTDARFGGELTGGLSYQFRVRHTAGTDVDACQPHNTWSDWSEPVTFKAKHVMPNIGAVSVTGWKVAEPGVWHSGDLLTGTAERNSWVGIRIKPVSDSARFPHGIILRVCSQENNSTYSSSCPTTAGIKRELHISRGQREAWLYFRLTAGQFFVNETITLFFLTRSDHSHWQWENPDTCGPTGGGVRPPHVCKKFKLTVTTNTSDSPPDPTPTSQVVETQQESATPVPPTATPVPPTATPVPPTATPVPPTATPQQSTSTLESRIQDRIDNGQRASRPIWQRALAAVRGDASAFSQSRAQWISDRHRAAGRVELADLWQAIANALD